MKAILIKQTPNQGADTKIFRASLLPGRRKDALGVSASTTGNTEVGVIRCAAKAFIKHFEPGSELHEIETRVTVTLVRPHLWRAELAEKLKL
jgi:hypothetical protein